MSKGKTGASGRIGDKATSARPRAGATRRRSVERRLPAVEEDPISHHEWQEYLAFYLAVLQRMKSEPAAPGDDFESIPAIIADAA